VTSSGATSGSCRRICSSCIRRTEVGALGGRLFLATVDAHLIALDARSGTVLWDTTVDNYKNGYYFTLAPLVARARS